MNLSEHKCDAFSVSENSVLYRIFLEFPQALSCTDDKFKYAQDMMAQYYQELQPNLSRVLWHHDPFNLSIKSFQDLASVKTNCFYLEGSTYFGDNINDEWFIVFLLFELTKLHQELVISVFDSDGEFILIEAAHHLPSWLQPDTSKNRVFISDGRLHIIPFPTTIEELTHLPAIFPSINEAINLIRNPAVRTLASEAIQEAILSHLAESELQMKDSLHFVNCFLPKAIINLLDKEEQLISKAVEAFCHKDPTDVKTMRRNLQFPVCFEDRSPLRGRYYKVKMTKCMYAQLDSQKCPLPASVSALISMNSQEIRLAHSMGMKITYGFEILYSRGPRMGPSKNNATFESAAFDAFLKYLEDRGYFKGELKGSKLHTKLLNSANSYFREFLRANLPRKPRDLEPSLSQVDVSQPCEKGHLRIEELSPGSSNSWLEISPQQLNALWEKRLGVKILDGTEKAPCVVANSVHSFVGGTSSHEGAEPTENIDEPNKQKIVDCLRSLLEFDNSYTNSNDELLTDEDILDENCSDDFSSSEIRQYYEAMDAELETTNLSKSFLKTGDILAGHSYEDEETDLNFNLVKNFFESYSSQQGDSGPVGNLLSSLGFLPPPDDPSSNLD